MLSLVKKYFLPVFLGILLGIIFMYCIISSPITYHLSTIHHLESELNDYEIKLLIYKDRMEAMQYFHEVTGKYLSFNDDYRIEPFSLDELSDEEIDKLLEHEYFKLNGENLIYSSYVDDTYYHQYLAESSMSWDCLTGEEEAPFIFDVLSYLRKLKSKIKDLFDFRPFIQFINCE